MSGFKTKIILLGTGTPILDSDRMGPSLAIQYEEDIIIFDAGPGLVRQANKAELNHKLLKVIFLSHLHSDHTLGLPDFMFTPSVLGRPGPIKIYGPPGTREMVENIEKAYTEDTRIRVHGPEEGKAENYVYEVTEIEDGKIYEEYNFQILTFLVEHGDWPSFGFKITTPDRTIIYSGDTKPCGNIIKYSKGCDILIHEVYGIKDFQQEDLSWQKYHPHMHTSTIELAHIANEIRPDLLILNHQLFFENSESELFSQIKTLYDGRVVSGHDLDVY